MSLGTRLGEEGRNTLVARLMATATNYPTPFTAQQLHELGSCEVGESITGDGRSSTTRRGGGGGEMETEGLAAGMKTMC